MKFMHLSDLHIGKRVNEFSMLEDQEYILTKIKHKIFYFSCSHNFHSPFLEIYEDERYYRTKD